jgi:four helix bundle protein
MFEELEKVRVYKISVELGDSVWREVVKWDNFCKITIGRQLVDAADSISANIAESFGRYHQKDVVNFLYISRGSLYETKSWLEKARERKLISDAGSKVLLKLLDDLAPQLNSYIAYKKKRKAGFPNHPAT